MCIQPEDEKINYETKYRVLLKGLLKRFCLPQRLLRPDNNMENSILVYCLVKWLFDTFSFSLLVIQHVGPLTHVTSFTRNILFTYVTCKIVSTQDFFYCILRNKAKKECIVWWRLRPTALLLFLNDSTLGKRWTES